MKTAKLLSLLILSSLLVRSASSQDSTTAKDDRPCIFADSFPGAEGTANLKQQAFFYREQSPKHAGCPNAKGCRTAAYLVTGDQVLALFSRNGWTCSFYRKDTQHKAHLGWIKSDFLESVKQKNMPLESWLGTWKADMGTFEGEVGEIQINPSQRSGLLKISGGATWWDGRTANGGSFDAEGKPKGNKFLHQQKGHGEQG